MDCGQAAEVRARIVRARINTREQTYVSESDIPFPQRRATQWHDYLVGLLQQWSIPALRVTLGLIFLWFGALKLFGASPVLAILKQTYPFIPLLPFTIVLGSWEVLIGCGLIMKRALRCTLALLCVHLTGTFISLLFAPSVFFQHESPLWLTMEGEFVVKNMVLMAAGLVIGGYEVSLVGEAEKHVGSDSDGEEREGALVYLKNRHNYRLRR
jgi:putative oxidoreductase